MAGPRSMAAPTVPAAAEAELLLLQKQALAEEEAAKAKRELLTRFLQDKLSREEQSSLWGLHKVRTLWRSAQRKAKDQELRQDIEILSQTFSRVMDCKDGVIETLVRDLKEAEEQQNRALRSHLHLTDQLLHLQRCRLGYLEEGFNAQVDALKAEFEAERRIILEQQDWESCCLRDMALASEQNHARNEHEALLNFQSARDDIKNQCWQDQQYSRQQLGARLEGLWDQIQKARRNYTQATERKKVEFEELKKKCEKSSREIDAQTEKLQKLQDMVTTTKGQIAAHLQESEKQSQHLRDDKDLALQKLQKLRAQVNQAGARAHTHLVTLTCQCSATLKALQQLVEKAQRILRLAEMCRRLEKEEEKVLPFYPSSLAEWEQQKAQKVLEEIPNEPLAKVIMDYVGLERFWQRFNKAKLEEKAMEKAREALANRNQDLRRLLQQYLAGAATNQKVLKDPYPILTVKRKLHPQK
ncbi:dynein regulatory complex subunit 2 [Oenanthe melanoleuca]|uniref:dynein regulatory complex subunit 2 n=1 Tax=Oenanthe melanoleuca TaxID=2939378 RepID=UPI0024C175A4|nr:dynein regulatory complex subunit 2 [Oenanthe melanoleuca]XP_056371023.1 dynein regulatory complex subunit 2 [Oenanthe melanoleuca]